MSLPVDNQKPMPEKVVGEKSTISPPSKTISKKFNRSQQFREKKGNEFMAENRKNLDKELFADFEGLTNFLKSSNNPISSRPIVLPISTRAVAPIISECLQQIQAELPNAAKMIDEPTFYRVTLAQLHMKVGLAVAAQKQEVASQIETDAPRVRLGYEFKEAVTAMPRTLAPLALFINNIGNFRYNDVDYYVRYHSHVALGLNWSTLPNLEYCDSDVDVPIGKFEAPPELPFDEVAKLKDAFYLLDRNNNLDKINEYGKQLSMLAVPNVMIDYSGGEPGLGGRYRRVKISTDIIDSNYGIPELQADLRKVGRFVAAVARKLPKLQGEVQYNAEGSCAQLVSTIAGPWSYRMYPHGGGHVNRVVGEFPKEHHFACSLAQGQCVVGALMLSGEYIGTKRIESPRLFHSCPYQFSQDFRSVLLALTG